MNNFMPELIGAESNIGPVRSTNEDAFWVSQADTPTELGALYIVADGVGGQQAGDVAANAATRIISQAFYKYRREGDDISAALERAIRDANQEIFLQAQAEGKGKMGCTLVAAVQHQGILQVAHVGDARAYYLTGDRLLRLTRDDTWVQKQVEAKVITQEQAAKHEMRNIVTQVLGNKEQIEVHLARPLELQSNDIFMLCSDGVHDPLEFGNIRQILTGKSAQAAAEELVRSAIEAGTRDNVTAVVVNAGQISGKAALAPPPASRKRSIPTWVYATAAAAVLFFVAGCILIILPALGVNDLLFGGSENEGTGTPTNVIPTDTMPAETAVPVLESAPTEETMEENAATSTIAPTETAEPSPFPTTASTDTPEPLRACTVGLVFLWDETQLSDETCPSVFAQDDLPGDTEVLILDDSGRTALGPDSSCLSNIFWEIQSVEDPTVTGWVLADFLDVIEPGESCTP